MHNKTKTNHWTERIIKSTVITLLSTTSTGQCN